MLVCIKLSPCKTFYNKRLSTKVRSMIVEWEQVVFQKEDIFQNIFSLK